MPPRLILATQEFPPAVGGVGDHTRYLARLLSPGAEVHVLAAGAAGEEMTEGFQIHRLARPWDKDTAAAQALAARLRPDLILFQYSPFMFQRYGLPFRLAGRLARLKAAARAPLIAILHEMYIGWSLSPLSSLQSAAMRWILRGICRQAERLLVTVPRRRAALQSSFGIAAERLALMPLPSNLPRSTIAAEEAAALRRRIMGDPARRLLVTFGTLQRNRLLEEQLRWLRQWLDQGIAAELHFLGDDRGDPRRRASLQGQIERLDLAPCVRFSGPLPAEEISRRLAVADFYFSLRQDGLSRHSGTLLAAMQHGRPVIANRGPDTDPELAGYPALTLLSGPAPTEEDRRRLRVLLEKGSQSDPLAAGAFYDRHFGDKAQESFYRDLLQQTLKERD